MCKRSRTTQSLIAQRTPYPPPYGAAQQTSEKIIFILTICTCSLERISNRSRTL
ncbi:hypothetical protein IFVP182_C180280 [Vibrio parahaemolyticus]